MNVRAHSWSLLALAFAAAPLVVCLEGSRDGSLDGARDGIATAKAWVMPRMADGTPDLQGVWLSSAATPLERPTALAGKPSLTDEEVRDMQARANRIFKNGTSDFPAGDAFFLAVLENRDNFKSVTATGGAEDMVERPFEHRTSLIVDPPDGRIPPLTPEGAARLRAAAASRLRSDPADPEDLSNDRRCLTFGTPRVGGNYGAGPYSYSQIVQAPGYVVLVMEYVHEARIIPLDGRPHLPPGIRRWNGDSRGRWEGDTLVVDTTNFAAGSNYQGAAERLHLVERFTRVDEKTLTYEVTVSDPTTWVRPWTALLHWARTNENLYEVACHEGERSMEALLRGAREAEKTAR